MSLESLLSHFLPVSATPYHVLNISSRPKKSKRILYSKEANTTIKTQHFISISQDKIIVFGIELYVYIIPHENSTERILFVSKADTSGLFDTSLTGGTNIKIAEITKVILKYILNIPLSFYLNEVLVLTEGNDPILNNGNSSYNERQLDKLLARWRAHKSLEIPLDTEKQKYVYERLSYCSPVVNKVCLFTRPEPQYLFPYSSKNRGKHVLSGDQLLRWWCKIINSIALSEFDSPNLKLLIPGADHHTVQRYFPASSWDIGEVFSDGSSDLAIHKVPIFPDDPKARFLEHLIVENRIKKVKMNQFWLELSVRQEFRLGMVVGVIGVSGILKTENKPTTTNDIKRLKMKTFKSVKQCIIEEDYSIPDELESFNHICVLQPNLFTKTLGVFDGASQKGALPSLNLVDIANCQSTMMVIKRKKKKTEKNEQ